MTKDKRGTMVVSLDFELSWGRFAKHPIAVLDAQAPHTRKHIKRLLALMDQFEIPATWATVGHLMLDDCARDPDGHAHSEVSPHAGYSWFPHDWYHFDPCTNASSASGWYAPDVLEWIRRSRVRHEIGSHSFAHIIFGDPECTAEMARADLKSAVEAAAQKGITLKSFVFPRNSIGHLEVIKASGIKSFRGLAPQRTIHGLVSPSNNRKPGIVSRLRRLASKPYGLMCTFLAVPLRPVRPQESLPGLWNIPANHFFAPRAGIRKLLPSNTQARLAKRSIDRAVQTGGLYHMWFHPFNLNEDTDAMFAGLEEVFNYADRMRDQGRLDILTMDDYAQTLEKLKQATIVESERLPV